MHNVTYDRQGRMNYSPELHHNHGKPYRTGEVRYLCQRYRYGNVNEIALALGRTVHSVHTVARRMRKQGLFDYYRELK
jgi:hypothetical protein